MKKYLFAYAVLATALLFFTCRHYRAENRRLVENQTALAADVTRYRTRLGAEAASVQALRLRCGEFETLRAADAEQIRRLGIRLRRLEAAAKAVAVTDAEIRTPLRDTVVVRIHDTLPVRDTVRMFRWRDPWISVEGRIGRDSAACRIRSVDTLRQVDEVKRFIDILAMHKLNVFHWHLSEDQGWRIEIKHYPLLTEIGSVRRETVIGRYDKTDESRNRYDGKPYGGFYTQDDVRAIVAYAAERYIEVIPEIDMPGHMLGALASYPQLGCRGQGYEVWTHWGISKDVLCAGKEETFEFVENVLAEVLDLFPSKFIHVGGDECPKERWKECPACQRRIREEGLANENELQSYFMHRVEKWLHEHGRELIGWDEIMQGGISKSAVIMAWTDQFRGTDAARKGNRVIMTPKWNCYLDYSQTSDPEKYEPIGPTRYLSMRQVYRLDPYDRLKPAEYRNILGIQGNVWTEYIADFGHVQRMTLPRMAAIAEIAWAYDRKDYDDFEKRAKRLLPELYGNAKLKFSEFFFEDIE